MKQGSPQISESIFCFNCSVGSDFENNHEAALYRIMWLNLMPEDIILIDNLTIKNAKITTLSFNETPGESLLFYLISNPQDFSFHLIIYG